MVIARCPQLRVDICAYKFEDDATFDVTLTHSLSSTQGALALAKRENEKIDKYKRICKAIGLKFFPFIF